MRVVLAADVEPIRQIELPRVAVRRSQHEEDDSPRLDLVAMKVHRLARDTCGKLTRRVEAHHLVDGTLHEQWVLPQASALGLVFQQQRETRTDEARCRLVPGEDDEHCVVHQLGAAASHIRPECGGKLRQEVSARLAYPFVDQLADEPSQPRQRFARSTPTFQRHGEGSKRLTQLLGAKPDLPLELAIDTQKVADHRDRQRQRDVRDGVEASVVDGPIQRCVHLVLDALLHGRESLRREGRGQESAQTLVVLHVSHEQDMLRQLGSRTVAQREPRIVLGKARGDASTLDELDHVVVPGDSHGRRPDPAQGRSLAKPGVVRIRIAHDLHVAGVVAVRGPVGGVSRKHGHRPGSDVAGVDRSRWRRHVDKGAACVAQQHAPLAVRQISGLLEDVQLQLFRLRMRLFDVIDDNGDHHPARGLLVGLRHKLARALHDTQLTAVRGSQADEPVGRELDLEVQEFLEEASGGAEIVREEIGHHGGGSLFG